MLDDINFGHSLLPGSSRDVVLEVEVAVINSLDPVPLPGVPPGHSHRDGGRDGVAVHWVVDHSALSSVGRHLGCVESRGGLTAAQDVQTDSTAGVALTKQRTGQETLRVSCRDAWGNLGETAETGLGFYPSVLALFVC